MPQSEIGRWPRSCAVGLGEGRAGSRGRRGWPVADDVKLEAVDLDGVKGEWLIVPG